jgi:predicted enzyme related to lactoylglutathione lyase
VKPFLAALCLLSLVGCLHTDYVSANLERQAPFGVVTLGTHSSYIIDARTETCLLVYVSVAAQVPCAMLKKNVPEAARYITWDTSTSARYVPPTPDDGNRAPMAIKINVTSVMVDDQAKALKFYTEVLGFEKKTDVPAGEYRWLTVVSPSGAHGIELLLEPMGFPPAKVYQKALFDAGIPITSFGVDDIQKEYERLTKRGVVFRGPPTPMGPVTTVLFEDTCGNLLMLVQA